MEIRPGRRFQKEFKKLLGRYRSLPEDVNRLEASLVDNPFQGVSLGKGCYKVRMAI